VSRSALVSFALATKAGRNKENATFRIYREKKKGKVYFSCREKGENDGSYFYTCTSKEKNSDPRSKQSDNFLTSQLEAQVIQHTLLQVRHSWGGGDIVNPLYFPVEPTI